MITVQHHILEQQKKHPEASGALTDILSRLATAGKIISNHLAQAGLVGDTGATNVQGETVMKMDRFADDTIFGLLSDSEAVHTLGSEERADPVHVSSSGKYVVLYDPLDGSSNLDYNVTVGTIFSIFDASKGILQQGRNMVAAGYIAYGPSTMLVYTCGNGVNGFTYNRAAGEFLLTHPNIKIPEKPKFYSLNMGYEQDWPWGVARFVRFLKGRAKFHESSAPPMKLRWVAALVADIHRNLLSGGVHVSCETGANWKSKKPKLRLLYEAAPMAFIAEQAGGAATDGWSRILDLYPEGLHDRTPLFIGNKPLVEAARQMILSERDPNEVKEERLKQYEDALKHVLELAKERKDETDPEGLDYLLQKIQTYTTNKLNWDNDEWVGLGYGELPDDKENS